MRICWSFIRLKIGDTIVAEGLKVRPRGKIKPIEKGSQNNGSDEKRANKII